MNTKDLQALTLFGPIGTSPSPVIDPLAVLCLDNRLFMNNQQQYQSFPSISYCFGRFGLGADGTGLGTGFILKLSNMTAYNKIKSSIPFLPLYAITRRHLTTTTLIHHRRQQLNQSKTSVYYKTCTQTGFVCPETKSNIAVAYGWERLILLLIPSG